MFKKFMYWALEIMRKHNLDGEQKETQKESKIKKGKPILKKEQHQERETAEESKE